MQPPFLQIVALWEDSATLRITHPDPKFTISSRPDIWEVSLSTKDSLETFIVDAAAACSDVDLRCRTPHSLLTVSVRGRVPATGLSSSYNTIKVALLPVLHPEQGVIMPDRIQVLWSLSFLGDGTLAMALEEVVTAIEVEIGDTLTTVRGPSTSTAANGVMVLTLANIKENERYDVRLRCVGVGGKRGTWSCPLTAYTLSPTMLQFSAVGEDYVSLVWGSNRMAPKWKEWALVRDLQLRLWSPDREAAPKTYAHDAKEDSSYYPNVLVVTGLIPNTVYHVRVRWWNKCGSKVPHEQYFRVCTLAPIIFRGIKKIGTQFVDIQFSRGDGVKLPPVHTVQNDDFENSQEERGNEALGQRTTTKSWRDISLQEVTQIPLFYRIKLEKKKCADPEKQVIFDIDPTREGAVLAECLQTTRLRGLEPGASYSVTVRCLGVARRDFLDPTDPTHGLVKSHWGHWSEAAVIFTAHLVTLKVDQRGAKKIDLQWSRPKLLEHLGDLFEVTTVRKVVVGLIACEKNEAVFMDEGDKTWGVDDAHLANAMVQRFDHADIFGQCTFEGLIPNQNYRLSLTTLDDEGEWSGRHSLVVATLREDVVDGRREAGDALPYIDEGYHLKEQDLPEWNDGVSTCNMIYQVGIGENRVKELRVLSAGRRSHVGLVAMTLDLDEVGEDYAVLSWRVVDVQEHTQPTRVAPSQHLQLMGHVGNSGSGALNRPMSSPPSQRQPWRGPPSRGVEDHPAIAPLSRPKSACAKVLNKQSEKVVTEYKLKICLVEEWAKSSLLCDVYFRSASRSTRVQGLKLGVTYTMGICRFDAEMKQWVPSWSNNVIVSPAKHLVLHAVGLSYRGILLEWRRTRELKATTPIKSYKMTIKDVTTGTSQDVVIESSGLANCPSSHYVLTEGLIGPRLLRASIVPQYKNMSWGCYSNEVDVLSVPVALSLALVSQSSVHVTWSPLEEQWLTPCDRKVNDSKRSMIFLSARGAGEHRLDEVQWTQSSHIFNNLTQRSDYEISGVAIRTVVKCSCCTRPWFPTFVPNLCVKTDSQLALTVVGVGESFVALRWPRGDEENATYEVVLTDVDTSTQRTVAIAPFWNKTFGEKFQKIIPSLGLARHYTAYVKANTGTHSNIVAFRTRALLALSLVSMDPVTGSLEVSWKRTGDTEEGSGACQIYMHEVARVPGQQIRDVQTVDIEEGQAWRVHLRARPRVMYSITARQAEIGNSYGKWSRPLLVRMK